MKVTKRVVRKFEMTIAKKLTESGLDFMTMSYTQLKAYGLEHHNNASGYSAYKKALLKQGVDIEALREAYKIELDAKRPEATHSLHLYSDAKAKTRRFAITNDQGNGLWYGREFNEVEQSACEKSAASKAIYLAGLARTKAGLGTDQLELTLHVDAEWLTYWKGKNKASSLGEDARRAGIRLSIVWVSGKDNPSDPLTVRGGFCRSTDNLELVVSMIEEL